VLLQAVVLLAVPRFTSRDAHAPLAARQAVVSAAALAAAAAAAATSRPFLLETAIGLATAAGLLHTLHAFRILPPRGTTVTDVARDPLTKGDDASLKALRFAHFFLFPGLLLWLASTLAEGPWEPRLRLAGLHVLLLGFATLCVYGLGHLLVPRFSGVPAIAAGAIKGQLHSTLGGVVLVLAGFLLYGMGRGSHPSGWGLGFLVAGGAFAFLGVFTHMGVLGANIMRNKSRTQRVTPEFAYVPWIFAGVFWLLSGILLGLFLNAARGAFPAHFGALRATHAYSALLGGVLLLATGWLQRLLPAAPPHIPFHRVRLPFLAMNAGLACILAGRLGASPPWSAAGAGLLLASSLVMLIILLPHGRRSRP
ncbi:MAG TPA: hypothetical protein VFH47_01160, partial [Candidatus Thermoplasmatota archaeon]|nr:hypothetical protein [Candidatus Thermoplasmatota archaeon]